MIDPHGDADDVISDVPELSVEEVEKRIGARERARRRRIATASPARIRTAPTNRRVILWRDSATILIFVVVALIAARFLLPGQDGVADASPTPEPTGVATTLGPVDTGFHFSQVPTLGPPLDPSNKANSSPTPIPVITLRPATPKPPKTPAPTKTPGPGATPAPTLPPVAAFTASCVGNLASFDASGSKAGTGATITSYDWAWDDGSGNTTATPITEHTYSTSGTYNVILTITTSTGGHDAVSHAVVCP
jgi:hypothetical protein